MLINQRLWYPGIPRKPISPVSVCSILHWTHSRAFRYSSECGAQLYFLHLRELRDQRTGAYHLHLAWQHGNDVAYLGREPHPASPFSGAAPAHGGQEWIWPGTHSLSGPLLSAQASKSYRRGAAGAWRT